MDYTSFFTQKYIRIFLAKRNTLLYRDSNLMLPGSPKSLIIAIFRQYSHTVGLYVSRSIVKSSKSTA